MYACDILCGLSRSPSEIPQEMSYQYIEIYVFYSDVKSKSF